MFIWPLIALKPYKFQTRFPSEIITSQDTYQAGWMELFLACSASFFGKGVVGAMYNWETDHAVFNALKSFIHIVFPQC